MILNRLFMPKPDPSAALYGAIVAAARQPRFYAEWGVPDSVDGRFDMIVLHLFLVLDRLNNGGAATEKYRQSLTDGFFLDMDRSLREMGVGDLAVGKKVRRMAEAYYGRLTAYAAAMAGEEPALAAALARNVFAGVEQSGAGLLADWTRAAKSGLARQDIAPIMAGTVRFP
jgi:cytochrome b pre-mRNA-processing protein 3